MYTRSQAISSCRDSTLCPYHSPTTWSAVWWVTLYLFRSGKDTTDRSAKVFFCVVAPILCRHTRVHEFFIFELEEPPTSTLQQPDKFWIPQWDNSNQPHSSETGRRVFPLYIWTLHKPTAHCAALSTDPQETGHGVHKVIMEKILWIVRTCRCYCHVLNQALYPNCT